MRFRITAWEDTAELRIYTLVADNLSKRFAGFNRYGAANGNAIENDALITSFELRNNAGELQNLSSATSNQNINLAGTIRLEGLDVSPDPTLYNFPCSVGTPNRLTVQLSPNG